MLTIKAPITLNCTKGMLTAGEDFAQRIIGNYELFDSDVTSEDFMHLLSQPAEVYLAEGENSIGYFANTNIENKSITKATVINNFLNRIMLSEEVDLTYQDRVYITDVLHKLGIKNTIEFMNEVKNIRQEQNNLSERLSAYWTNSDYLQELVEEYTLEDRTKRESTEINNVDNNSYLHQDIYERLKTAALYQIVNNFTTREKGLDHITSEELLLSEQKYFAEKMLVQSIENLVLPEKVPLVYYTDNIYEEDASLPGVDETEVRQNITNALLFNTIRSVLESRREERNVYNNSWYQVVENLYRSGEVSLSRMSLMIRQNIERLSYNRTYENDVMYRRLVNRIDNRFKNITTSSEENVAQTYQTTENITPAGEMYHTEYIDEGDDEYSSVIEKNEIYNITGQTIEAMINEESGDSQKSIEATEVQQRVLNELNNRIDNNTVNLEQSLSINTQTLNEISETSEMYHTDYIDEGDTNVNQDIDESVIYNITEESLTNITEEQTRENTEEIKKFLTQQNIDNRTQNEIYLEQLTENYEASKPHKNKEDLARAQRLALESPEEFMKEFREENQREQERKEAFERQKRMLTPPQEQNIYEIINNYLENPANVPEGVTITKNNIGSLLRDSREVERSIEKQEEIIRHIKDESNDAATDAIEQMRTEQRGLPQGEEYTQRQISHANIIHREQRNEVDEEMLQEIMTRNRSVTNREIVQNTTTENTTVVEEKQINDIVSRQLEEQNRRIEDMIEGGMNAHLGSLSDKVYRQIEKRLNNERRRRGV